MSLFKKKNAKLQYEDNQLDYQLSYKSQPIKKGGQKGTKKFNDKQFWKACLVSYKAKGTVNFYFLQLESFNQGKKDLYSETVSEKSSNLQRIVSWCAPGGFWLWTKFSRLDETISNRSLCSEEETSFDISFVSSIDKTATLFSELSAWSLSLSLEDFAGLFPANFNLTAFLRFQHASSTQSGRLPRKTKSIRNKQLFILPNLGLQKWSISYHLLPNYEWYWLTKFLMRVQQDSKKKIQSLFTPSFFLEID